MTLFLPWIYVVVAMVQMHQDPFLREIPPEAIPAATSPKAQSGLATMYGTPDDRKWGAGHLACAPDYRVQDLPEMHVCAHRTYRCGTILAVENPRTGLRTLCRVLDRGPYGALLEDGTWAVKIRASDPGTWRGIADMTPAVAKAIGHTGFGRVKVWPVFIPAKRMIVTPVKKPKVRRSRVDRVGV